MCRLHTRAHVTLVHHHATTQCDINTQKTQHHLILKTHQLFLTTTTPIPPQKQQHNAQLLDIPSTMSGADALHIERGGARSASIAAGMAGDFERLWDPAAAQDFLRRVAMEEDVIEAEPPLEGRGAYQFNAAMHDCGGDDGAEAELHAKAKKTIDEKKEKELTAKQLARRVRNEKEEQVRLAFALLVPHVHCLFQLLQLLRSSLFCCCSLIRICFCAYAMRNYLPPTRRARPRAPAQTTHPSLHARAVHRRTRAALTTCAHCAVQPPFASPHRRRFAICSCIRQSGGDGHGGDAELRRQHAVRQRVELGHRAQHQRLDELTRRGVLCSNRSGWRRGAVRRGRRGGVG
jgi:hypothetical protein